MKIRDNKGSITVFVLVGLLFMTGFLIISFGSNINKSKNAKEQLNILSGIYSQGDTDLEAYERAYTALRRKNAEFLTTSNEEEEDKSTLELTKTFKDKISNYKIYGNSVQNNTTGEDISPSNPVQIQSVGDRTSNLVDLSKIQISTSTAHVTYNYDKFRSTLELTSTPTAYDYTYITDQNLGLEIGKTYYYGGDIIVSGKQTTQSTVVAFSLSGSAYSAHTFTENGTQNVQGTFTYTGQSSVRLRMFFNYGSTEPAKVRFENIYVSEVNEYEPYGYKVPVKVSGKNLLNSDIRSYTNLYGIQVTYNEDGSIHYGGTATTAVSLFLTRTSFTLPAGTYTINNVNNTCRTYLLPGYLGGGTFTLKEDTTFTGVYVNIPNGSVLNDTLYPQLEQGTTATEYEPYVEPITTNIYLGEPLRKIGEYKDYIDFGNKQVIRNIKEIIFDGTESWQISGIGQTYERAMLNLGLVQGAIHCNIGVHNGLAWNGTEFDVQASSDELIRFYRPFYTGLITTEASLENWKAYLAERYAANNPIILDYVPKTPDDPQTIDLPEFLTFEDYTKIEVLTEIAPSKIEATYYGYTME